MDISFSEAKGMFSTAIDLIKKGSQMEAQSQIQKLQEQYLELHAVNLEIKQELFSLREKLAQRDNMVFEEPFFYLHSDGDKVGPYCPKCWQKDEKKCRVVKTPESYGGSEQCQVCNATFGKGKPVPRPEPIKY
ncbi:hypothetical protein [Microbulbifer celer]|uniref:Uncharacterized protein n=1 Tax=Microbulbifer celer TaxID=435905 RepID=A0ABW3UCZ3_9GAMM|nr:hypothetical protein [Microbulbifer celer]UFN56033.1 hypothetical protein LPW13_10635 [Microbulbifer celer]